MNPWVNSVLAFLALTNLVLLATSRLANCIRMVAIQGAALALMPLLMTHTGISARVIALSTGSFALKAVVFPWLLTRALRIAHVRREVEPFVGYNLSLAIGVLALSVSFWVGSRLPLPDPGRSSLVVPVSLFTILVGLFLIIGRRKALIQVAGYLVLENGIYAFGVALVGEVPMLVELGILLDAFVAVLAMGIAIYQINREFDSMDVDQLQTLKG
jgi:hydrogenase-4 component E